MFEWRRIGDRIKKILDKVEESEIGKDWYFTVQKIQERYERNHLKLLNEQKYSRKRICIICKKEPNCLEKNLLSREEHHMVKFGPLSGFWIHSEAYLKLI